jgi:hypothetical protein
MDFILPLLKTYFLDEESIKYVEKKVTWTQSFLTGWGLSVIMNLLFGVLLAGLLSTSGETESLFGAYGLIAILLGSILVYPIGIVIFGGIWHLLLKLFGGQGSFEDTIKFMVALSLVPAIVSNTIGLLPVIGAIVLFGMFFWSLYVAFAIYSRIHKITQWRVFGAFVVIFVALFVIFAAMMMVIFSSGL